MRAVKKTESLTVRMAEPLYVDLLRLAAEQNRLVSEYVRSVLANHVYGHARRVHDDSVDADDAARSRSGRDDV